MTGKRNSIVVFALAVALAVVPTPVNAGEDPHNRDCDGIATTIATVCAGADAGGNANCENLSPTEISCSYVYSWNLLAESPVMLPGAGDLEWAYLVTSCITGVGCTVIEEGAGALSCGWTLPGEECRERDGGEGGEDYVLELGQCVTVTSWAYARTAAWVTDDPVTLWEAETSQTGENGGQACALDDGRD